MRIKIKILVIASALFINVGFFIKPSYSELDYNGVAHIVSTILFRNHYSKHPLNEELSKKIFNTYIDLLDPNHHFFTQEDIDKLSNKYANKFHKLIFEEEAILAATEIFDLFYKRISQRIKSNIELIENHDFKLDTNEKVKLNRENIPFPKSIEEADKLWLKILTNKLIIYTLEEEKNIKKKEKRKIKSEVDRLIKNLNKTEKPESHIIKINEIDDKVYDNIIDQFDNSLSFLNSQDNDNNMSFLSQIDISEIDDKPEETIKEKIIKNQKNILKHAEIRNHHKHKAELFISSIAQTYDPHSTYDNASDEESFLINMGNNLVGIGAVLELQLEDGSAEIKALIKGGPALKSGKIKIKDRIIAVGQGKKDDFVNIIGKTLSESVSLIRGKEGKIVRLKIKRKNHSGNFEIKEIPIIREKIQLKDNLIYADLIEINRTNINSESSKVYKIGWCYTHNFYAPQQSRKDDVSDHLKIIIDRLKKENVDGIVLDLRKNGGGSLQEAIQVTGLFIPKGPVVSQKDFSGSIITRRSSAREPFYDGPLIVLTDRLSASASEIVAAALQDYKRAILVGDSSTYGKGTVQNYTPLDRFMRLSHLTSLTNDSKNDKAGSLKITVQKFYRIAGGTTQKKGVIPDIILPSELDFIEIGEKYLKNPLDYDTIPQSKYTLFNQNIPIEILKIKSEKRVKSNIDFDFIIKNNKDRKEKIDSQLEVSLNLKERREEKERKEKESEEKFKQLKEKYTQIKKEEKDVIKKYRITLENVTKRKLTEAEKVSEEDLTGQIFAKDDDDEDELSLKYPNDLGPHMRETILILIDYIEEINRDKDDKIDLPLVKNK